MSRRRPSRSLKKTWNQYLCYEYPVQLADKLYDASRSSQDLSLSYRSSSFDLLDDPPRYRSSESDREVAICRATLRVNPKFDSEPYVLFLERQRVSSNVGKNMGEKSMTKSCACNDNTHPEEEASLEHRIWEFLKESDIMLKDSDVDEYNSHLQTCFAKCVYACWAEFLDTLTLEDDVQGYTNLLQQCQRSLERNMDAETTLKGVNSSGADWRELLDRLERRVRLAVHLRPAAIIQMPAAPVQPPSAPQLEVVEGGSKPKEEASSPEAEENKRSLDRVAYLGGVLLPMTIVSGILAMGDTFGPTGDMFYVFWATAIPITLLTLAIIYADSIRRVEVWIEEAQSTYDPAAAASGMLLGMKKKKPLQPGTATPDLEQAVPYSETVPIDYSVPETATTRIGEPVTYAAEEPVIVAQPEGQTGGDGEPPRVWVKEELGWLGACKTILGIYKLQEMKKRPWHLHTHEDGNNHSHTVRAEAVRARLRGAHHRQRPEDSTA
ncbi:cysteine protease [Apiospora marii]|uniref:Cysteine protease n=1 Tax=Apiospora marii TaxID=335849 RepID=A0ABR1RAL4_9PEZI